MEARVGIEPTHKGFADLSLTTWVPRPCSSDQCSGTEDFIRGARQLESKEIWSGRRDLNPRLRPWQGRTLPLSYSRSTTKLYSIRAGEQPTLAAPVLRSCHPGLRQFELDFLPGAIQFHNAEIPHLPSASGLHLRRPSGSRLPFCLQHRTER